MITLKWHGTLPVKDLDLLELTVLKDIKQNLKSLDKPSELIFHTVFIGPDYNGPSVLVWGEEGDDDHFHCEYKTETEWVTLKGDKVDV